MNTAGAIYRHIDYVSDVPKYRALDVTETVLRLLALLNLAIPFVLIGIAAETESPELGMIGIISFVPTIIAAVLFVIAAQVIRAFRDHVTNGWQFRRTLAQLTEQNADRMNGGD